MLKEKRCPNCHFTDQIPFAECPCCGVVIEKFRKRLELLQDESDALFTESRETTRFSASQEQKAGITGTLLERMFYTPGKISVSALLGRSLALLIIALWGLSFFLTPVDSQSINESFLHLINLPFHEAGHIIFSPFGEFITSLGGTLGQLMIPLLCVAVFIWKFESFGAAVCLWWFGQNFIDISPYIADARAGVLPLIGGNTGQTSPYGFHDWNYLLTETGLLKYDQTLATFSHLSGTLIMLIAVVWGGLLLFGQFNALRSGTSGE